MSFIRKINIHGKIYLAEVENVRINGRVVQRHIRYIGRKVDDKTILSASISQIQVDRVKIFGPLLVLNHIAQQIRLPSILGKYSDEIMSLVYAHCIDYKSINQMSRWFERTDLNSLLNLEGLTEERLLAALDSLESQDSNGLQKKIFHAVREKYNIRDKVLLYDVTNTYLYGKRCPLSKYGKDKEGVKGRPLIQIGLGITKTDGIPVMHKVYDGNIPDSRTLQDMLTSLREFDFTDGYLIFDRGISSKKNQQEINALRWKVVCGLPLDVSLKKVLRLAIMAEKFLSYKNRVRLQKTVFYVITRPYAVGGIRGRIALCFNEQQRRDLRESRYDEVTYAQELLRGGKKVKPGMEDYFDARGQLIIDKLKEEEEFDGYSVVFTTASLTADQMVKMYFDKDLIEKAFQSLKGVIRVRPVRHWLYNRVTSHVFICYLSYLLLSLLRMMINKLEISPVEALMELDSMYKVYMHDEKKGFKITRVVTLTKRQENILKAVDPRLLKLV
ncbi:MAG: IS1634 family transposase [Spirochaetota bacterium]